MRGHFIIRPRVLLVGNDITLLYSREMLLGTRFAVQIAGRNTEALQFLREHRFDVVAILEPNDTWARFAGFVRQQIPAPRLVVVAPPRPKEWTYAIVCEAKMYDLMKCCMELFGMVTKTKSKGFSNRDYRKAVTSS